MPGLDPFNGYGGPAGLIDRFIGEQYTVVKAVYDQLPTLPDILTAVNAVGGLVAITTEVNDSRDQANNSASSAASSVDATLNNVQVAKGWSDQAEAYAVQAKLSSDASSGSATGAANSATQAGQQALAASTSAKEASTSAKASATSATAASGSAGLAQSWATQTAFEVVAGQGYGAKKYSLDAASSALSAQGFMQLAQAAQAAAQTAKNQAVQIATFDPTAYALTANVKRVARRAAMIFGS